MTIELTDQEATFLRSLLSDAQESLEDSLISDASPESETARRELAATNSLLEKLG